MFNELVKDLCDKRELAREENRKKNDETIRILFLIQRHCLGCKFMRERLTQAALVGPQSTERFCHVNDMSCVNAIDGCWKVSKESLNIKLKKVKNYG